VIKVAVIKLTKKEKLDQLVARITLETGHKPTQQDVVDAAVDLADEHFDELQIKLAPTALLDDNKISKVMALREKLSKIEWITSNRDNFANNDDVDIYST